MTPTILQILKHKWIAEIKDIPNTGNEEVNEENDLGIPDTGDDMNDPTFEKPSE